MITILLVLSTFNFHGMEACWTTGTKHLLRCYETAEVSEVDMYVLKNRKIFFLKKISTRYIHR